MNWIEDCALTFGKMSEEEDIKTLKSFLTKMRSKLAKTTDRIYSVDVVHYKFISRNGIVVVDRVKNIDISHLFDFDCRDASWTTLYTHNGLVATDLLLMLKEEHKWDGYRLELAIQGSILIKASEQALLEVA
jgi:hypothetical protein